MGKTVKVPNPVYDRIEREAEREDVSRGAIVRDWMEQAEKFRRFEEDIRGRL